MLNIIDIRGRHGYRKVIIVMLSLLLSLICVSALADVEINETNFPDANFRAVVAEFDTDGDGTLSEAEIENVTEISCIWCSISDITGIEHFTALTELDCSSNQLTSLDVSKNSSLTHLECDSNQLTSLDVSGCTALTYLDCHNNQLSSLDVSGCMALTYLYCEENQLTSLDVRRCTALKRLGCLSNQLMSLDLSQNTALTTLYCHSNQLTSLDLSNNVKLLEAAAKKGPQIENGVAYFGVKYYDGSWWVLDLTVDVAVTILPEGTMVIPTFILPTSLTKIESQAFTGITNQVFQIPSTVTFIADDAFDSSSIVIVEEGSYAEERCTELGLKVHK